MDFQIIKSGDIVKINIEKVTSRDYFQRASPGYRKLVLESAGKIFHAVDSGHSTFHLAEEPKWLFLAAELIKVEQDGGNL